MELCIPISGQGLDENSKVEVRTIDGTGEAFAAITFTTIALAADFSATPTSVLQGNTVIFSDKSGSVNSRTWSFPGGIPSTSTDPNPVVTYNTVGTYNVSLAVNTCSGEVTETKTGYITVNAQSLCSPTLFQQDFSSSTTLADYISATPGIGQFNNITSSATAPSITGGGLYFQRTSSSTQTFSRITDLSNPAPLA